MAALNWLVKILIEVLLAKGVGLISDLYNKLKRKEKAHEQEKPLENAKTKEEIDAASDDALNGF